MELIKPLLIVVYDPPSRPTHTTNQWSRAHKHPRTHVRTHIHTQTDTHASKHALTHSHTQGKYTLSLAYRTPTCTPHTHTAHTHSHTHKHAQIPSHTPPHRCLCRCYACAHIWAAPLISPPHIHHCQLSAPHPLAQMNKAR